MRSAGAGWRCARVTKPKRAVAASGGDMGNCTRPGAAAWMVSTIASLPRATSILAVFLLLGCVMDSMAIILIFVPLFTPTLVAQGFDLVWFAVIVVVLTEIGLITPPVGMNVFVLKANLPKVPVGTIFRGLVPFIGIDVLRLSLLVAFPSISLYLVQLMK